MPSADGSVHQSSVGVDWTCARVSQPVVGPVVQPCNVPPTSPANAAVLSLVGSSRTAVTRLVLPAPRSMPV